MSNLDQLVDLKKFEKKNKIGEGGFGEVFQISSKETGNIYAAKISFSTFNTNSKESILTISREVNINAKINHPCILKFIGYSPINFNQESKPVIITEFISNGSLSNIIELERLSRSVNGWTDTKKIITIYGIASGMSYLHSHNILHRDLKPSNILMDDYLFPKISDFGLSKIVHIKNESMTPQSTSVIKGTSLYLSPEIINDQNYSKSGDVYAFSIILYEILTSEVPFKELKNFQILPEVVNGRRPNFDFPINESFRDLIERCWSQNPNERPSFEQIVDELKNNPDFLTDSIEKEEYMEYIDFIDEYKSTFDRDKTIIKIEDFIKSSKNKSFQKVELQKKFENENKSGFLRFFGKIFKQSKQIPFKEFDSLSERCKFLIEEAEKNSEKKFLVGKNFIEGKNDFPLNIEIGIQYLEQSNNEGYLNATLYLCEMLLKGNLIPLNIQQAKKYLSKHQNKNDPQVFRLFYKIIKKDKNISELKKYIDQGVLNGNVEALHKIGIMSLLGKNCSKDDENWKSYLILAKNQGYEKSDLYLSLFDRMNSTKPFCDFTLETQHFLIMQIIKYNLNEFYLPKIIKMKYKQTELLFNNKSFESAEFINEIKKYENISVEIKFPSSSYNIILNKITEIKQKEIPKINIIVFFTEEKVIKSRLENNINIKSVVIDPSTEKIDNNVFLDCYSLREISIPPSITSIGSKCFKGCKSLNEIKIPSFVKVIEPRCFSECKSLTRINIPLSITSIDENVFYCCSSLIRIEIPLSVTSIGESAFYECWSLKEVIIHSKLKSIGPNCFSGCSSLKNILIPSSVVSIGDTAFYGCSSLTKIEIPSSVKKIGTCVFQKCLSLREIIIHSSLTSINDGTFLSCSSLEEIAVPSTITSIESNAFFCCSSLKNFRIPSSVHLIGSSSFSNCSGLVEVFIPTSVKSIDSHAFSYCKSLVQVHIHSKIKFIGECAFYECSSLKEFEFPESTEKIESKTFYACSSLMQIKFSPSLKVIGNCSFSYCSSLTTIEIPSNTISIGSEAFYGCSSLCLIDIPSSVRTIGNNAFAYCSSLNEFFVPSSLKSIAHQTFSGCSQLMKIEIPSSVTSIGDNAFQGCSSLKIINIPSSVSSIGFSSFKGCLLLKYIGLPSIPSIGFNTFQGCSSLKQINIPSSVTSICSNAFHGCSSLLQIEIPSSVTFIGDESFRECSMLSEIKIPSSVANLGSRAFFGCLSLQKIVIENPEISIKSEVFKGCSSITHISIPSDLNLENIGIEYEVCVNRI